MSADNVACRARTRARTRARAVGDAHQGVLESARARWAVNIRERARELCPHPQLHALLEVVLVVAVRHLGFGRRLEAYHVDLPEPTLHIALINAEFRYHLHWKRAPGLSPKCVNCCAHMFARAFLCKLSGWFWKHYNAVGRSS